MNNKFKFPHLVVGCSVVAALTSQAALAAKNEPIKLSPSSKWNIDYAENKCTLARAFREGDSKVIVMLEKYNLGDAFALTFSGVPMDSFRRAQDVKVTFGPNEEDQKIFFYSSATGGAESVIFINSQLRIAPTPKAILDALAHAIPNKPVPEAPPITREQEAAVKYIMLSRYIGPSIQLETGPLQNALAQMNDCLDSLAVSWGFDPAKIAKASRKVTPIQGRLPWITYKDYPASAINNNQMGTVNVRLNVGTNGRVESCHILQVSNPIGFANFVCKTLSIRARFEPALDAAGAPMASYYVCTVSFALPSN